MVHLTSDHDQIGEPLVWCGATTFDCSEDPDAVNCIKCLEIFMAQSQEVEKRLTELKGKVERDGNTD